MRVHYRQLVAETLATTFFVAAAQEFHSGSPIS
jgi:hypothetical protein